VIKNSAGCCDRSLSYSRPYVFLFIVFLLRSSSILFVEDQFALLSDRFIAWYFLRPTFPRGFSVSSCLAMSTILL